MLLTCRVWNRQIGPSVEHGDGDLAQQQTPCLLRTSQLLLPLLLALLLLLLLLRMLLQILLLLLFLLPLLLLLMLLQVLLPGQSLPPVQAGQQVEDGGVHVGRHRGVQAITHVTVQHQRLFGHSPLDCPLNALNTFPDLHDEKFVSSAPSSAISNQKATQLQSAQQQ